MHEVANVPRRVNAALRRATLSDLDAIREIYNEGIADRIATLETEPRSPEGMAQWWSEHDARYAIIVASAADRVVGWASLNRFSHRCAHAAIADLSVYVSRAYRGRGIGAALLDELEREARGGEFHKIVLHALNTNEPGKRLYRKCGFSEVGVFREHGILDGCYADVVAMEKILHGAHP